MHFLPPCTPTLESNVPALPNLNIYWAFFAHFALITSCAAFSYSNGVFYEHDVLQVQLWQFSPPHSVYMDRLFGLGLSGEYFSDFPARAQQKSSEKKAE